jgi:hypothetical protein
MMGFLSYNGDSQVVESFQLLRYNSINRLILSIGH